MRKILCGPSIAATIVITATTSTAQQAEHYRDNLPVHHPAVQYELDNFDHPVAKLAQSLDGGGRLTLDLDRRFGYLPSLLHHLDIRLDSQVLVFSKTSLQAHLVSPRSPRAIYFSDTVAVGFVPGADVIEIAAFTSKRGTSFYTLNTARTEGPKIVRSTGCLSCHQGPARSLCWLGLNQCDGTPSLPSRHRCGRPPNTAQPTMGWLVRHRHPRHPTAPRQ